MGLFSKSSSSANVVDARVTGVEASVVASGGGSSSLRDYRSERLPEGTIGLLEGVDARRSSESLAAIGMVLDASHDQAELAQGGQSAALQGALAQRSSETETLANALQTITPIILGGLGLMALALVYGGGKR